LHSLVFLVSAAGQTAYEDVSSVSKVRTLRSSQRSHPQHQPNQQTQPVSQQSNALFQQPSASVQQQVVLCSSPQYQAFSMSDLGSSSSPSHSPPSQPPPSPQLPSYALSPQVAQCYKQPYQRTSPQQQPSFPSFRLPSSPVSISHSPTPGSEPPSLRQAIASPTVRSPSLRSNSLPGLQDDTFVMPKVSTATLHCLCMFVPCSVHLCALHLLSSFPVLWHFAQLLQRCET
jgi:hypothetical protein